MEKILIFIKHHLGFIWKGIEVINAFIFHTLYKSKLNNILTDVLKEFSGPPYIYRKLVKSDRLSLFDLINSQEAADLDYFRPHKFDMDSIRKQFENKAFLMMGVFDEEKIIGYFFLRFFANKKCFVGRLIDKNFRGKGIGPVMNNIMYETAWRMGFRCLSTISRNNQAIMRSHAKNPSMVILKELQNDYLLVEFLRKKTNK